MRKKIAVIMAAIILISAGLPLIFMSTKADELYDDEQIADSEATHSEESNASVLEATESAVNDSEQPNEAEAQAEEPEASETAEELEESDFLDLGTQESDPEESIEINTAAQTPEIKVENEEQVPESAREPEETKELKASAQESPVPEETEELEASAQESPVPEDMIGLFAVRAPDEAIVKNFTDLKNALANDNGITAVYLGDNIVMQSGIKINPKKADIFISGLNPLEPEQQQPYTLTDFDSAAFIGAIYIDQAGTKNLHIQDLTIIGKNFYGPFSIADLTTLSGITVTYERVNYDGPQLGYHRKGTVRFIDCTASIHGGNSLTQHQEFSEVKHLIFEGRNTIDTSTNTHSIFWHPFGGSFKIADDSSLVLTSPDTSSVFGVFYADGAAYKIDISIGRRASLSATISGVVAPSLNVSLSSLTVREGGELYLKTTKSSDTSVLEMGGAVTVESDARFIISGYGGASTQVLLQESGDITIGKDAVFQIIAERPYMNLLNLAGRAFLCNDPANVLFYNANRDIRASASAGRVYINAQQINYWNRLSAGDLDSPPLYRWDKPDKSNFRIDGELSIGANGNFSSISSNYSPGDPPGTAPNANTFSMPDARVLSAGRLELFVTEPTTRSTSIGGITAPYATVRVFFTQQDTNYTFPDVTADSNGIFHVPIDVPLNQSTIVNVASNWQYLTTTAEVEVEGEGELAFFVPETLEFFTTPLSSSTQIIKRLRPDWRILVSDTRENGAEWAVYARLESKLTPSAAELPALEDALVFIDKSGKSEPISTDNEILIQKHTPADGEDVFPITWNNNNGILLFLKPGAAFADTAYTATISWTLVNGV